MWVKVCGITRVEDARVAAQAQADAIGFVFAASPRRVSVEQAQQIAAALGGRVSCVGVFVEADVEEIVRVHERVGLRAAQLHGAWTASNLRALAAAGVHAIPALRFDADRAALSARTRAAIEGGAREILLDAAVPGKAGGTGVSFDWQAARDWAEQFSGSVHWIAAGGLTVENVARAIDTLQPWGVDVSSGIESSPGIKNAGKIQAFVRAARAAGVEMAGGMERELI